MLVEDNPDCSQTLMRLLKDWGHSVRIATDGTAALAAAVEHQAQVAIVDIGLPGNDGCTVAAQLKKASGLENLHLIAISGFSQESDRERAIAAGCHEFLLKPVEPAVLRTLLEAL